MGMSDCKACGGWFSSTAPIELCPTCERALKRLNGYAVPVVRCKDCNFCHYNSSNDTYKCVSMNGMYGTVNENEFCSYGERREGE